FDQMDRGKVRLSGEGPLMVLERIRDNEPEPFVPIDSSFPQTAAKIIGRLLQKDPAKRYQTARELSEDLQEIDTVTARHSITPHSRSLIGRTRKRSTWTRVAIIAASALIITLAIYYAERNSPGDAATSTAPLSAPGPIRSLAVLPMTNIGNNAEDAFLSVGLADALTTKVQKIPSLQVRPTSAVIEYRNQKTIDVKAAGQ